VKKQVQELRVSYVDRAPDPAQQRDGVPRDFNEEGPPGLQRRRVAFNN